MEMWFELVKYLLIRERYPLQIFRRLLFLLIYSDNTMHVLRQAGGGNQGLHLSEIRSAHNGLAGLWAALCVPQFSLISHRKTWRIAPTLSKFSSGFATLKTIFLLLCSICIIMLSESPLLWDSFLADLPPSCKPYPAATTYLLKILLGKSFKN